MRAVREELGQDYSVEPTGREDMFSVKQGMLSGARVRITQEQGVTNFHVHGIGLIIGRIINELGIARHVASAIGRASLGRESGPASGGN